MLIIQKIICVIVTFFMMLFGMITGTNWNDTTDLYKENVNSVKAYSNTLETAVPQTKLYNIINNHFKAPLAEGKTEKRPLLSVMTVAVPMRFLFWIRTARAE